MGVLFDIYCIPEQPFVTFWFLSFTAALTGCSKPSSAITTKATPATAVTAGACSLPDDVSSGEDLPTEQSMESGREFLDVLIRAEGAIG